MGEGCGHLEEDMCMYLNDNAINFSKNGEHRLITKEEAYEILTACRGQRSRAPDQPDPRL